MTFVCLENDHKYKCFFLFFIMVSSFYDYQSRSSLNRATHTPGILNCCFISVHSAPVSAQTPVSSLNLSPFVSFPLFSCQTLSFSLISAPLTLFPFFPQRILCHWWNNNILKSKKGKSIIRHGNTSQNSKYPSDTQRSAAKGQIIEASGKTSGPGCWILSEWCYFFTIESMNSGRLDYIWLILLWIHGSWDGL